MRGKLLRSAREDALNEVEAGMLLTACRDLLDNLTVRLPLFAGSRIGEVQHLKKSWLNWDKGVMNYIFENRLCEAINLAFGYLRGLASD